MSVPAEHPRSAQPDQPVRFVRNASSVVRLTDRGRVERYPTEPHLRRRRPPQTPLEHGSAAASRSERRAFEVCSRAIDVTGALFLIAFLAPLMLGIALCVWAHDGGAPVFGHERLGKGGRRFRCLKFRSMVVDAETRLAELLAADPAARAEWLRDHKLRRDPRVTAFGRFLRKSSLDELPQLINVLAGDMSLVGPRPIVEAEIPRYGRWFDAYCSVRPGLTGLWQVSGRNDVSYRRRVAMDVLYARYIGLALYLRVLAWTLPAVVTRRGAS